MYNVGPLRIFLSEPNYISQWCEERHLTLKQKNPNDKCNPEESNIEGIMGVGKGVRLGGAPFWRVKFYTFPI